MRYADNFLIGFIGSKKEEIQIVMELKYFLNINLQMKLSVEKSRIKHHKKGVTFRV